MDDRLIDLAVNLIAAGIGGLVVYFGRRARTLYRDRRLRRSIGSFFGNTGVGILIIHSAIFDEDEQAYNYPATDTRAARNLAVLFEKAGLREGVDFSILPDRRIVNPDELSSKNVILVCGPSRNHCFSRVAPPSEQVRYAMTASDDGRTNWLVDQVAQNRIKSSRQRQADDPGRPVAENFDFGLIASLPNPLNSDLRVVVLAGIHGTGTVGATEYIADPANLQSVNARRTRSSVCEVVRVTYTDDIETPTGVHLL